MIGGGGGGGEGGGSLQKIFLASIWSQNNWGSPAPSPPGSTTGQFVAPPLLSPQNDA